MPKSLRFLAAAVVIGGGCWVASAWGQQSKRPADPLDPVSLAPIPAANPEGAPIEADHYYAMPYPMRAGMKRPSGRGDGPVSIEEMRALHEVVERFRSAKEGPEKEGAKKALSHVLEQSFTRDLEHREREVSEIEARVHKLREQIERRKKAKDEIVGLRLKTIINETEGLGFPGSNDAAAVPKFKHPEALAPTYDDVLPKRRETPAADDKFTPRPSPVPDDAR